jgi:glycosyltransferase involved in cell wall biosynthesis
VDFATARFSFWIAGSIWSGFIGVEKKFQLIAAAFRQLCEARRDVHLILVGDGPYRRDLEKELSGLPVTITGFLEGEELSRAIASADVKLFPSTTDTWGSAPLEAQACGLPVIVSDVGGPPDLMVDGLTGLKIKGRDVQGLYEAMLRLMDESTRHQMGRMARTFVEVNRVEEPFTAILDSELFRRRLQEHKSKGSNDALLLSNQILELGYQPENGEVPEMLPW